MSLDEIEKIFFFFLYIALVLIVNIISLLLGIYNVRYSKPSPF